MFTIRCKNIIMISMIMFTSLKTIEHYYLCREQYDVADVVMLLLLLF